MRSSSNSLPAIDKSDFGAARQTCRGGRGPVPGGVTNPRAARTGSRLEHRQLPSALSLPAGVIEGFGNIDELTGTTSTVLPDGSSDTSSSRLPWNCGTDIVLFRIVRDQVTRLRAYQQRFLLPMLRAMDIAQDSAISPEAVIPSRA